MYFLLPDGPGNGFFSQLWPIPNKLMQMAALALGNGLGCMHVVFTHVCPTKSIKGVYTIPQGLILVNLWSGYFMHHYTIHWRFSECLAQPIQITSVSSYFIHWAGSPAIELVDSPGQPHVYLGYCHTTPWCFGMTDLFSYLCTSESGTGKGLEYKGLPPFSDVEWSPPQYKSKV